MNADRFLVQEGADTLGDPYRLEHDADGYWLVRPDGFETRIVTMQGVCRVLAWLDEQPLLLGAGVLTDGREIAVYVTSAGPSAVYARDARTGQRLDTATDHAAREFAIRVGLASIGMVGIA